VTEYRVGWDDDPDVAAWASLPSLPGDRTVDACVVRLGASGLAAVDELADRGLQVVGVDAGRVAAGAAGRKGASCSVERRCTCTARSRSGVSRPRSSFIERRSRSWTG
jgi:hypothetical protein